MGIDPQARVWREREWAELALEPVADRLNPLEARALYEFLSNLRPRDFLARTRTVGEAENALVAAGRLADWLMGTVVGREPLEPPGLDE